MVISTGSGNDQITCSATGSGAKQDVFAALVIDAGAGNDRVVLKHDSVAGDVSCDVTLGSGRDDFQADVTGAADAVAHYLKIKLDAGSGSDSSRVSTTDMSSSMSALMGKGGDSFVLQQLRIDKSSPKLAEAVCLVDMGDGNDLFSVSSTGVSVRDAAGNGLDRLRVDFSGGTGNDRLQTSLFDVFSELSVDSGTGNDACFIKFDGVVGQSAVTCDTGAGNDQFTLEASGSFDHKGYSAPVGDCPDALSIKFDGSDGNDSASTSFFDVFVDASLDGGAGSDQFTVDEDCDDTKVALRPASLESDVSVSVDGGDGSDTLSVSMAAPASSVAPRVLSVSASMGAGSDKIVADGTGSSRGASQDAAPRFHWKLTWPTALTRHRCRSQTRLRQ